jgi:hypothetical protein
MNEMTNMTTSPHTGKRSVLRLTAAGLVTLLACMVAAVFWIVSQAQYTNDYCTTRASRPEPANPEALGGRPAYMDGPYTIVCEYDGYPTLEIFDPTVLIGALILAAVVVGIGVGMFRWAWRPKPPKRPDSPAEESGIEPT